MDILKFVSLGAFGVGSCVYAMEVVRRTALAGRS